MSGSIRKRLGFSFAVILIIFVIVDFIVFCFTVRLTSSKYRNSIASSALDMAEFTIDADLAKETFSTRAISDRFTAVQGRLESYQKRNSASVRRISLVSFSNTSGGYIYDTGGKQLGDKLEYDEYTSSVKAELINGRNPLKHEKNGILSVYRPLRTVDDNLCGYVIVELNVPYENAYSLVIFCIFAGQLVFSLVFVFILVRILNKNIIKPIKQITKSAVYLSGEGTELDGQDASAFFATDRNDEIGELSSTLQKILFNLNSNNKNLSQALFDANHDGMTKVLNKRCYSSMVGTFQSCSSIGIIYFDVNNLKLMNDTLGHENGDYVITSAADYIKQFQDSSCHCFRMGGDEFLLVMTNCLPRQFSAIVDRLEKESPKILSRPEDSVKCSLSYGYSFGKEGYVYEEALAEAEKNMYEKKAALKKLLNMPER